MKYYKISHKSKRANGEIIEEKITFLKRNGELKPFESVEKVKFIEAVTVLKNNILGIIEVNTHKYGDLELYGSMIEINYISKNTWYESKFRAKFINDMVNLMINGQSSGSISE